MGGFHMYDHQAIKSIVKIISLALSIASLVLLSIRFSDTKTILVLLSIAIVCNGLTGMDKIKKQRTRT